MTKIGVGEVVTLSGAAGRDRHVCGAFRATAELDVDALLREFRDTVPDELHGDATLPVLAGRLGNAMAAVAFGHWLVGQGHLERVPSKVLDLRVNQDDDDRAIITPTLVDDADVRLTMAPGLRQAWLDEAARIYGAHHGGRVSLGKDFDGACKSVTSLLVASGLRWDAAVMAGIAERYAGSSALDRRWPMPGMTWAVLLRMAWAVVRDDESLVPEAMREPMARHLAVTRPQAAITDALSMDRRTRARQLDKPVPFTFAFAEDGPKRRWVTGEGRHVLEPVDAEDAPVAAILLGPSSERVKVRNIGGALFREVLSPGSWETMTTDAFERATASGEAWRDDPFALVTDQTAWTFDVFGPRDLGRRPAPGDADPAMAALVSARVGRTIVVEGRVMVPCPSPTLRVWKRMRDDGTGGKQGLTWALGPRLCGVNHQHVIGLFATVASISISPGAPSHVHWSHVLDGVPLKLVREVVEATQAFEGATRNRLVGTDRGETGFGVEFLDVDLLPHAETDLGHVVAKWCNPELDVPEDDDVRSPDAWEELARRLRWSRDDAEYDHLDADEQAITPLLVALAETHADALRSARDEPDLSSF